MRVVYRLNEREQVSEILEFEPRCDCTAILWTDEYMKNIIVHGLSSYDITNAIKGLCENGFFDFRRFRAEYFAEEDY